MNLGQDYLWLVAYSQANVEERNTRIVGNDLALSVVSVGWDKLILICPRGTLDSNFSKLCKRQQLIEVFLQCHSYLHFITEYSTFQSPNNDLWHCHSRANIPQVRSRKKIRVECGGIVQIHTCKANVHMARKGLHPKCLFWKQSWILRWIKSPWGAWTQDFSYFMIYWGRHKEWNMGVFCLRSLQGLWKQRQLQSRL